MAQALGIDGDSAVNSASRNPIPQETLNDSVLIHLAAAYLSVSKQLERKTQCSETRGYILSTLRNGAALNQNQIAVMLGYDRTVVHRAIKTLIREKLAAETKAPKGKALLVKLTEKGNRYRSKLIEERRAAEEKLRSAIHAADRTKLIEYLKTISDLSF
jgi:DNA-binding MarR family transcriptional regulator